MRAREETPLLILFEILFRSEHDECIGHSHAQFAAVGQRQSSPLPIVVIRLLIITRLSIL